MRDLPFGLKPFSIMAIVFGVLGILGSGMGLVGLYLQKKSAAPAAAPYAEMNEQLQKVAKKRRPLQLVVVPVVLLTSVLLLLAGIGALKLQGLGFIRLAFAASLLADSASSAIGISVQMETIEIMQKFFRTSAAGGSQDPMAVGMRFGLTVGLYFAVGWLVAKTGFYVAGLVFFGKRSVREAFSPPLIPGSPPSPGPGGAAS